MREMLNIDSDSLRKFTFRYAFHNLGPTSARRRTKKSTSDKYSSCYAKGKARMLR